MPVNIDLIDYVEDVFRNCARTMEEKSQDYNGGDDPFRTFRTAEKAGVCSVEQSILARIFDKLGRIANLTRPAGEDEDGDKRRKVVDETVYDTIEDAINYLAILHAYL